MPPLARRTRWIVLPLLVATLASCVGPSLGDAARLWCEGNSFVVYQTGKRLGVYSGNEDPKELPIQDLLTNGPKGFTNDGQKDHWYRACNAAYEARNG